MGSLAREIAVSPISQGMSEASIDPIELFDDVDAVWLEVGFGGGEHLVALAQNHPRMGLIGCEYYMDGVAKLVTTVARENLTNIRLHAHDARDLMDSLIAASVSRAYLLYPDPWPKKRHHKRRFFSHENLDSFARILRSGAELRVASDIDDYIRHCLAVVAERHRNGVCDFYWTAQAKSDWLRPWNGWVQTRYEAKAIADARKPQYLIFRRR
jgi:tRNA (guanine-N7-)-methyltransferase